MRAIVMFASCLLLAGCSSDNYVRTVQGNLKALRADIVANPQTTGVIIAVLVLCVLWLLWAWAKAKCRAANPVERPPFANWLAGLSWDTPDIAELKQYAAD